MAGRRDSEPNALKMSASEHHVTDRAMKKQHTFEFSQKVAKPTARTTIGFRVDEELFAELTRRAKALGVSPHELARHYVMELLSAEEERTALRETVNAVGQHMIEIRKDIALAVEALLSSAGTLDEKQAHQWTQRNLFKA